MLISNKNVSLKTKILYKRSGRLLERIWYMTCFLEVTDHSFLVKDPSRRIVSYMTVFVEDRKLLMAREA